MSLLERAGGLVSRIPSPYVLLAAALGVLIVITFCVTLMTKAYNGVYDKGYTAGISAQLNAQLKAELDAERKLNEAQNKYNQLVASIPGQIQAALDSAPEKVKVVREAAKNDKAYAQYRRPAAVDRLRRQQLNEIGAAAQH